MVLLLLHGLRGPPGVGRRGVPRPLPGLRRQPTSAVAIQGLVFRGLGFRVKISSAL